MTIREMVFVYAVYDPRSQGIEDTYEEETGRKFKDATTQELMAFDRSAYDIGDVTIDDILHGDSDLVWQVVKIDENGNIVQ